MCNSRFFTFFFFKKKKTCGSGGEVDIAIVAPPRSLAHDEGVVTFGPHGHGVSIEHQRIILAIRGGRLASH